MQTVQQKFNFFYGPNLSCKGCGFQLNSTDPAYQYQTQKIIQNTVRVPSSLYTMNLGGLTVYEKPELRTGVNWNQMSDRAVPSKQSTGSCGSSGSSYHSSSTRRSLTRMRPGAASGGGVGVDIKHNSYDRYLARIKGKGPLRRGVIPPNFGSPVVFNPAFPIYGGKTMKTAIINGCNCANGGVHGFSPERLLYVKQHFNPLMFSGNYIFKVGDAVYTQQTLGVGPVVKGTVISVNSDKSLYTIQFSDGSKATYPGSVLLPYFPCNCEGYNATNFTNGNADLFTANNLDIILNGKTAEYCSVLNAFTGPNYLNLFLGLVQNVL
jgi:hypothetical protein